MHVRLRACIIYRTYFCVLEVAMEAKNTYFAFDQWNGHFA